MVVLAILLLIAAFLFGVMSVLGYLVAMAGTEGATLVNHLWFFFSVLFFVLSAIFVELTLIREKIEWLDLRLVPREPPQPPQPKKR